MKSNDLIAKVIVDVPTLGELDYKVPEDMLVALGDRVLVTLGRRRVVGIVVNLVRGSEIAQNRLRSVTAVLNDIPPLPSEWLRLTRFAAGYYQRSWGEAALSGLPLFLKRAPGKRQAAVMERMRKPLESGGRPGDVPELNDEQKTVLDELNRAEHFKTFLLFGVTGSGKTEVYLRWMEETLRRKADGQILFLVPEINLTPQSVDRIRSRFPERTVAVLHSELSDGERARNWLAVHEGRADILVGTRTAVFASFKHLALVIVDEEHDGSYKAGDGLRFSARDLAVWRGKANDVPVLLGSATPSLESWMKASAGQYKLLTMAHRASGRAVLPEVTLTDPPEKGSRRSLTDFTVSAMTKVLEAGRQVLVFINRRGYAQVLSCPSCNWVSSCRHCSTFTVFHKSDRSLVCHHCGWRSKVPEACPVCGNVDILPRGSGTERIFEELEIRFPGKRVLRIDRDSVSRKHEAEEAFAKVHAGEVDILVGTQMVAKGHDFRNVGLVVILNADAQLLSPATRAREMLFATLMQVAGRAGRHGEAGRVVIQTRFATDPFFEALAKQDYRLFADALLDVRRENFLVPFTHQALLTAQAPTLAQSLRFLEDVAEAGHALEGDAVRIYDPVPMNIVRLKELERAQLLVECDDRPALNRFLRAWQSTFRAPAGVQWTLEVDPAEV